ncbi:MAG: Asp-tRNA(Asn)/Glu-tRNA(Gln) amidotransferase subunit GatC [Deltaproteobacteria bacterium]
MALSKETVKYVAELSRMELEPQELEKLSRQLEAILDFIDQLKELDISAIEPTSHILPISNVFREDTAGNCLPVEKTLANAPEKEGNFFAVPKVIE